MDGIVSNFRELGVDLNPDWLAGLELCADGPLTDDDVYTALMYSDLRDSCVTPINSALRAEVIRDASNLPTGSFLFQLTSSVDISIPDAQRPRTGEGIAEKRMLKFDLHSSSSVSFQAVEMENISCLSNEVDAGCKVILVGSPRIHNGIIFLRPENVRLVGGEVPKLNDAQRRQNIERRNMRDTLSFRRRPLREIQNLGYLHSMAVVQYIFKQNIRNCTFWRIYTGLI
jgi:hypothetical protein